MDLKETCDFNIFKNKDIPIGLSKEILNMPESGFKEFETSKKVYESFKKMGLKDIKSGIARTGIKAKLTTEYDWETQFRTKTKLTTQGET